ncbi:MAG: GWxTD domain-containing protein [Elusimicrobia bacterium]|nr:GWxTD domain-containing protein [Elusimicrobiota bacterium]
MKVMFQKVLGLVLLGLILNGITSFAFSQGSKRPKFSFNALSAPEKDGSTTARILIEIPLQNLNFRKQPDDSFSAKFSVRIKLGEKTVSFTPEVKVDNFRETQENLFVFSRYVMENVSPGLSSLSIRVEDLDSHATFEMQGTMEVHGYSKDKVGLSTLELLDDIASPKIPNLSGVYLVKGNIKGAELKNLPYKFTLYNPTGADSVDVTAVLLNSAKGDTLRVNRTSVALRDSLAEYIHQFKDVVGDKNMPPGQYEIRVQSVPKGRPLAEAVSVMRPISVDWEGVPPNLDLGLAMKQIKWLEEYPEVFLAQVGLGRDKEMAKNISEKLKRIRNITRGKKNKNDPPKKQEQLEEFRKFMVEANPDLLNLYFGRVTQVEKGSLRVDNCLLKFSYGKTPGWETDQGRVWIVLGPPSGCRSHEPNLTIQMPGLDHRFPGRRGVGPDTKYYESWFYERHPYSKRQYDVLFYATSEVAQYQLYWEGSFSQNWAYGN